MHFQKPPFCRYPLLKAFLKTSVFGDVFRFCADQCEQFHKNGGFSCRFHTKTEQCERGLRFYGWGKYFFKIVRNAS